MRVGVRPEGPLDLAGMLAGLVPNPLFEAYFAPFMARTIMAGVRLGVFDALAERPDTSAGVAERLGLDPRGADALLVALHSLGYLDQRERAYRNASQAERHLVSDSPAPLVDCVGTFTYDMWELLGGLEEAVRSGEPVGGLHDPAPGDPWWESYMRGLFELSQLRAGAVVRMIPASRPRTLLDVAGGHGGFSIAMCRRHEGLAATVLELEGAALVGRRIVAEQGFADRVSHRVGDMFEDDLGDGYDVAMANSILHHFPPERDVELLARLHAALAPGGTVAVVEQERPPEGARGDQIGALTGVLFYVSSGARTYTARELEGFLADAGFVGVRARRSRMAPGIVVVSGTKGA